MPWFKRRNGTQNGAAEQTFEVRINANEKRIIEQLRTEGTVPAEVQMRRLTGMEKLEAFAGGALLTGVVGLSVGLVTTGAGLAIGNAEVANAGRVMLFGGLGSLMTGLGIAILLPGDS